MCIRGVVYTEHFNPLPPHGGRPQLIFSDLSTPDISIHSLRMEGDLIVFVAELLAFIFQSTPSAWRETDITGEKEIPGAFQSTPSAWRETPSSKWKHLGKKSFQSTPSAWRETWKIFRHSKTQRFQSTPSAWRETRRTNNNAY